MITKYRVCPLSRPLYGKIWYAASTKRFKDNIRKLEVNAIDIVRKLLVRSFTWNKLSGDCGKDDFGIIAEDAYAIEPKLVNLDKDGKPVSIRFELISYLLLQAFQELILKDQDLPDAEKTSARRKAKKV